MSIDLANLVVAILSLIFTALSFFLSSDKSLIKHSSL